MNLDFHFCIRLPFWPDSLGQLEESAVAVTLMKLFTFSQGLSNEMARFDCSVSLCCTVVVSVDVHGHC